MARGTLVVSAAAAAIALSAGLALAPVSGEPQQRKESVTLAATGDIAMGRTPILPPAPGRLFAGVDEYLRGDVVLGNLEGTLTARGVSKCRARSPNCFAFRTPPSYARWLKRAGFSVMNLANNHSHDFGPQGFADTVAALRRARLRHTGRPNEIAVVRAGRIRTALVGFAPYPWAQDLLDLRAARRLVRRAAARADVVVVTMHAGAEGIGSSHVRAAPETYLGEPRGNPLAFAHAVVDAAADLVVGHGPHVLRGMEWYRGRLIAYSLGNFAGYHTFNVSGLLGVSGILSVTLRADGSWVRGRLVAARLIGSGTPAVDRRGAAHGVVRRLSRQDFGRRAVRVLRGGALVPPRGGRAR